MELPCDQNEKMDKITNKEISLTRVIVRKVDGGDDFIKYSKICITPTPKYGRHGCRHMGFIILVLSKRGGLPERGGGGGIYISVIKRRYHS